MCLDDTLEPLPDTTMLHLPHYFGQRLELSEQDLWGMCMLFLVQFLSLKGDLAEYMPMRSETFQRIHGPVSSFPPRYHECENK